MLKSKLHRIVVTNSDLDYPGSIGVDSDLLAAAGIRPYETVMIADLDNGSRLSTYVIEAPAGSGEVTILGAAAHKIKKGDIIIIFSFAYCTPQEAETLKPQVVTFEKGNKIKEIL